MEIKIFDDVSYVSNKKGDTKHKPRMSQEVKEELITLVTRIKNIIPQCRDIPSHTVQVVFTGDKAERVITISRGDK